MADQPPGGKGKQPAPPPAPKRLEFNSGFEDPAKKQPAKGEQRPVAKKVAPPRPVAKVKGKPAPLTLEKKIQTSAFARPDARAQVVDTVLGKAPAPPSEAPREDDPNAALTTIFDGQTPAPAVAIRDLWKVQLAPAQSRPGRRSPEIYRNVINQFAVGHNPRYDPDGDKIRAHIFIWDLTRAMGAEVPHFVGAKELALAQTCDWVRHEGPSAGWRRVDQLGAIEAARRGQPVLVMPKEIRTKMIAVVRPDPPFPDGRPHLAGLGPKRGNDLAVNEALGVFAVDYFVHT